MEAQGQGSADWAGRVFAFLSAGADTKANAWGLVRGRGALELGDLRLLEDGGERGGALVSNLVVVETVNKRRDEDGERSGVHDRSSHRQRALT